MNSKNTTPDTPPVEITTTDSLRISSQDLFQGRQEICIEHEDQVYRLRITRQRKLILTK